MAATERLGRVMASRLRVIVEVTQPDHLSAPVDVLVDDTLAELDRLEACWSRFIASSDVTRINQLGSNGGTLSVDPSTQILLASMLEGVQSTAGRFDPTLVRELVEAGYVASHLDPDQVAPALAPAPARRGLDGLSLDPVAGTVSVPPGLVIDPGGVGKGLAADLAVHRLLSEGVDGACVEIGGDLALGGSSPDPAGWLVDVEHPDAARGIVARLAVSGGGVATSSVRSRRWRHGGRERHHQIDPHTGTCSSTDLDAVTVIAASGWRAEVHATAALAVGSGGVVDYLEGHGLSGIAIAADRSQPLVTSDLCGVDLVSGGTDR